MSNRVEYVPSDKYGGGKIRIKLAGDVVTMSFREAARLSQELSAAIYKASVQEPMGFANEATWRRER